MQFLKGMTQKTVQSTIEKSSVQVVSAFLPLFGCPAVKETDFVLVSHAFLNDASFSS